MGRCEARWIVKGTNLEADHFGTPSLPENSGAPHSAQNALNTRVPESAHVLKTRASPFTVRTAKEGNATATVGSPPEMYRQSLQ